MSFAILGALPQRIFGVMTNEVLLAIPLFIFMGVMLERSRIAEDLLETMGRLFGTLRGGFGISAVIVGTLLAAAKGVVGATTVTMGLIMLPAMLRFGYDPRLAAGTVAATATLAQIFPPATVLVLLGDQLGNAYQAAQLSKGIFSPRSLTVSDLFAGALVPGFALVALYLLFLIAVAVAAGQKLRPRCRRTEGATRLRAGSPPRGGAGCAAGTDRRRARLDPRRHRDADRGRIDRRGRRDLAGGAQGAACHAAAAGLREDDADRQHDFSDPDRRDHVQPGVPRAWRRRHGASRAVQSAGRAPGAVLAVMLAMFLLGFVMDAFEIIFVVVPIVAPTLLAMPGVDPVWLGDHDGGEFADFLYAPAARADAVLSCAASRRRRSRRVTSMSASFRSC